jgi:hypothetical protein
MLLQNQLRAHSRRKNNSTGILITSLSSYNATWLHLIKNMALSDYYHSGGEMPHHIKREVKTRQSGLEIMQWLAGNELLVAVPERTAATEFCFTSAGSFNSSATAISSNRVF